MGWINISEKFPEKETLILLTNGKDVHEGMLVDAHFNAYYFTNVEWDHHMPGITHWMPRPQPPKQEQQPSNSWDEYIVAELLSMIQILQDNAGADRKRITTLEVNGKIDRPDIFGVEE